MYIKPAAGRVVRDPVLNDYVPPEGREVTPSIYWNRRVNDGDVVLSKSLPIKPEPPAAKPERSDAS
ncbi:MAG: DUF2635 domain-containing protein [Candidimonas sp.]|nr:MAG: DUF2635 domain-containing protein [Candidimonas sp.]TAM23761.1 MAG: DUF2635 domain-containing protein [Candidimonas sp.]